MRIHRTVVFLGIAIVVAGVGLGSGLFAAGEAEYVGQAKCTMCHKEQHQVWSAGAHSGSLELLEPADREKDECLACHTTGRGQPTAGGADMAGVQCEACHGPGSLYKSMKIMSKSNYKADPEAAHEAALAAGLVIPDETTCTGCHNAKSPTFKGFDFAAAKEKIKHWE